MKINTAFLFNIIFLSILLVIFSSVVIAPTQQADTIEQGTSTKDITPTDTGTVKDDSLTTAEFTSSTDKDTTTIDTSSSTQESVEIQGTTSEDYSWTTPQGSISSFSMTNALFSLGSLIQGSFISFSNNNNIYFSSLFDASTFTATLDEEGSVDVGQKNSFGEMGKVIIQIENGNLTQDNDLIFIPNTESATYIYYNTTEVEFEDGNLTYFQEIITNNNYDEQSSTVSFDENGFTKIKLNPSDEYTNGDFSLLNTEQVPIIICKEDPLCDINIEGESFTIDGKVNFSYKQNTIYQSLDENNEATLDFSSQTFTINNPLPKENILSIFYNGHIKLTETQENIFFSPLEKTNPNNFKTYTSLFQDKTLSLEDNTVSYQNFLALNPESSLYTECLENEESCILQKQELVSEAPESEQNKFYPYILFIFVLIGLVIFFFPKISKTKRKSGQMTLFIALGFIIVIGVIVFFLLLQSQNNTAAEISTIESLTDAQIAVQNCIQETIITDLNLWSHQGGYLSYQRSFSSFNTSYDLLSLEELQDNLEAGLERSLDDCGNILENTPYKFTNNGRLNIDLNFAKEIEITGNSLGIIHTENNDQSLSLPDLKESFDINFPQIYTLVETLIESNEGIPITSSENYIINIFASEDYKEVLIEIQQEDPTFIFRITKIVE